MGKNIIVSGFHRSGTSLTAQLLNRSGLFMGDDLLGADYSNVYGHAEDREIVRLHDGILNDNGLSWQVDSPIELEVQEPRLRHMQQIIGQREAEHTVWGFKDPRVCLFLDVWKNLLPDVKALIVYRSPVETTSSLHRRAATGSLRGRGKYEFHRKFWEVPDLSLNMWVTYNNMLLKFAHIHPEEVLVLSFDMLRRGFPLISLLNQQWELGLEELPPSEVFDPNVTAESYNRAPVANTELIGDALKTWNALERLSRETENLLGTTTMSDVALTEDSFRSAEDTYDILIENEFQNARVEFLQARTQELEQHKEDLRTQLEEAQQRTEALKGAETDLKLIVNRMSRSKLAPILRLKEEFRELEQKYSK